MEQEITLGSLVEIKIYLNSRGGNDLARVVWLFSSGAEIRGGRVSKSTKNDSGRYVQFPAYRAQNGQFNPIIIFREEEADYLKEMADKQYLAKIGEGEEPFDEHEEIDLDKVPF